MPDLLEALVRKYYEAHPGDYDLRINVMKVRRRWWSGPRYLQIDYRLGDYSGAELEQRYDVNVGCAGSAVGENRQFVFDAVEAPESWKGMSETQRLVTAEIRSILSTPIYAPNDQEKTKPIGVLNLDSQSPIAETGFKEDNLLRLAARYAALTGITLQ